MKEVVVVDLFAGPGGLGEGFASVSPFKIRLSVEKEPYAHQTLTLRSFLRQFAYGEAPEEYYTFLRQIDRPLQQRLKELFDKYPGKAERAESEAWRKELGKENGDSIQQRIAWSLGREEAWVLIGGPPCQAYSIAGRSRNKGNRNYCAEKDGRQFLYLEYLQAIADHEPCLFVMENVKGLLSAALNNQHIFDRIVEDLKEPSKALQRENRKINPRAGTSGSPRYRIFSLVHHGMFDDSDPLNFVVQMERHGIPQARHRLILLGVHEGLGNIIPKVLPVFNQVPSASVLAGLPKLRSGLTDEEDNPESWRERLYESIDKRWFRASINKAGEDVYNQMSSTLDRMTLPRHDRGNEFIECEPSIGYSSDWYIDPKLRGVCNHITRPHMLKDLYRYFYAACFARVHDRSPILRDFPADLLPDHKNVQDAMSTRLFADRFRVQLPSVPATTITSHIAKDGHYYIHYDPGQCRSLTVREAARIQTFPDNYFFCGPRTAQYTQIGNAVPPLLAKEIALIVLDVLKRSGAFG